MEIGVLLMKIILGIVFTIKNFKELLIFINKNFKELLKTMSLWNGYILHVTFNYIYNNLYNTWQQS